MASMFETRTQSWRDAGLARQLTKRAIKRARIEALILLALLIAVLLAYHNREQLFGAALDTPARIITAIALIAIGWQFARDVGRSLQPYLYRRLDPATAGTVGFLVRLVFVLAATIVALRFAGLTSRQVALGGAFTAVVFGLAAQQTLGNLFAGIVLLSARPFRVGERVRMQGGPLAGTVEGVVSSLGLLYTVLANGADQVMVPNSVVLNVAVVPLREPDALDLVARLEPGTTPEDLQRLLDAGITVPLRERIRVSLEEIGRDAVVMRIQAVPERPHDGPTLASEVLDAMRDRTASVDAR
jgi:small-conductance mechanosensitive channel